MSEPSPTITLFALTRPVLAELLAPESAHILPRIADRLDASADALILGADLVPRPGTEAAEAHSEVGIDPTIAAITLAQVTRHVGLIVAAAPQRDHPYNLARRLASIDHASRGRVGVFLGSRDPSAAPGSPWTNAPAAEAVADTVTVLRELWRSFPIDVVIGDRESGVFAESHRILAVDHHGAFDVTGPLQVPSSPQLWPPVLIWSGDAETELAAATADLTVGTDDPRYVIHWPADLTEAEQILAADSSRSNDARTGSTLRTRLGLPPAAPSVGGRPVFPNPDEQPVAAEKVGPHGR